MRINLWIWSIHFAEKSSNLYFQFSPILAIFRQKTAKIQKNGINLNCYGSDKIKSFSAGSLLMYESVDKLLNISGLLRSSGLKVKGVDLAYIVKPITCGVLDRKRRIRAIDLDVKGSGKADYVNSELGVADKRVLYRAVEVLGPTGHCLYQTLTQRFQEKTGVKIVQADFDYTSSYFEGTTVALAKHGYSRDHRPDKKQVKLGLVQVNDEKFARTYFLDSGEKTD